MKPSTASASGIERVERAIVWSMPVLMASLMSPKSTTYVRVRVRVSARVRSTTCVFKAASASAAPQGPHRSLPWGSGRLGGSSLAASPLQSQPQEARAE